jgi:DNA-directed RNA polymerase specialized sigma24 family protein
VHGIAKNLCKELLRGPMIRLFRPIIEALRTQPAADAGPEAPHSVALEERHECLSECIGALPPETSWITQFYECEKSERIRRRLVLAESLGVTPNTLRVRAHSIRQRLRECLENCLGQETQG